jgi:hypothetical protein
MVGEILHSQVTIVYIWVMLYSVYFTDSFNA